MNHRTNTNWNGHEEWHRLEWAEKFADFIHVSQFLLQRSKLFEPICSNENTDFDVDCE